MCCSDNRKCLKLSSAPSDFRYLGKAAGSHQLTVPLYWWITDGGKAVTVSVELTA